MSLDRIMNVRKEKDREAPSMENPIGDGTVSTAEHERSWPEIEANPRLKDLFVNRHLLSLDPVQGHDLVLALTSGQPLSEAQRAFRHSAVESFNKQMAMISTVNAGLTSEEILRMAKNDPAIKILQTEFSKEHLTAVMKSQLHETALSDPSWLTRVARDMKGAHSIEHGEDARRMDKRVHSMLEKYGITEKQYTDAMRSSIDLRGGNVDVAGVQALQRATEEQLNVFYRIYDALDGGSISRERARKVAEVFTEERDLLFDRDREMGSVGRMLLNTLTPEKRNAMEKALAMTGAPVAPDTRIVKNLDGYKSVHEQFGTKGRKDRFAQTLIAESIRLGKEPANLTDDEKLAVKDKYAQEEVQYQAQGQRHNQAEGFMSFLLGLLFNQNQGALRAEANTF